MKAFWTGSYTNLRGGIQAPDLKGFLDASAQVANVDNTLAVGSSAAGFQLYGQFQFDMNWVRPMPLYSIPGLVDHH